MSISIAELQKKIEEYEGHLEKATQYLKNSVVPQLRIVKGLTLDPDYDTHALFMAISEPSGYAVTNYGVVWLQIERWKRTIAHLKKWQPILTKSKFFLYTRWPDELPEVLKREEYLISEVLFSIQASGKDSGMRDRKYSYEELEEKGIRELTNEDLPLFVNYEFKSKKFLERMRK